MAWSLLGNQIVQANNVSCHLNAHETKWVLFNCTCTQERVDYVERWNGFLPCTFGQMGVYVITFTDKLWSRRGCMSLCFYLILDNVVGRGGTLYLTRECTKHNKRWEKKSVYESTVSFPRYSGNKLTSDTKHRKVWLPLRENWWSERMNKSDGRDAFSGSRCRVEN